MRIKSYFASSVEAALRMARIELGEDAMLISVRRQENESGKKGAYEVVFGVASKASRTPTPSTPAIAEEPIAAESKSLPKSRFSIVSRPRAEARKQSVEADATTAGRIVFVGPAGSGKTTMVMKCAFQMGVQKGRKVRIISLDADRIGAGEPLRTFCKIVQIPFSIVTSAKEYQSALSTADENELTLIDTPGYGANETPALEEGAALLRADTNAEVHLVLNCTSTAENLALSEKRFQAFHPSRVIYTRTDETASRSNVVAHLKETTLSISFLGTGRGVFEGLSNVNQSEFDTDPLEAILAVNNSAA